MAQRRLMNQINVVPYIDVMLVLLVIFMVTAPMIQTGTVELPSVRDVPQAPTEAMIVYVKADGSLALQETSTATPQDKTNFELAQALTAAIESNPQQPIVVAADKDVRYERVMETLDELRRTGFQKVGLQTQAGSQSR